MKYGRHSFSFQTNKTKLWYPIVRLHMLDYCATVCWDLSYPSFFKEEGCSRPSFHTDWGHFCHLRFFQQGEQWQYWCSPWQYYVLFMLGPLGSRHYKKAEHCYWVATDFSLQQQPCFNGKVLVHLGKKMEMYSLISNIPCQKIFFFFFFGSIIQSEVRLHRSL